MGNIPILQLSIEDGFVGDSVVRGDEVDSANSNFVQSALRNIRAKLKEAKNLVHFGEEAEGSGRTYCHPFL